MTAYASIPPHRSQNASRFVLAPIVRFPEPARNARLLGGWTASAIVELVSGSPLNATMSAGTSDANLGLFGGRQRPNVAGDPNTSGNDADRVSSADHPDARWFSASAFQDPGPGRYGNAPRTNGDARYQFRKNVDLVIAKDTRIGGNHTAQIRFEILNLTNTPRFNGSSAGNAVNLASFGRITSQRGFMRQRSRDPSVLAAFIDAAVPGGFTEVEIPTEWRSVGSIPDARSTARTWLRPAATGPAGGRALRDRRSRAVLPQVRPL